jgi:hypothetical protein
VNLNQDLATIDQKERIRRDYLEAVKVIKSNKIEQTLKLLLKRRPMALRRLVRLIFREFTIKVIGQSTAAKGEMDAFIFADELKTICEESLLAGWCPGGTASVCLDYQF